MAEHACCGEGLIHRFLLLLKIAFPEPIFDLIVKTLRPANGDFKRRKIASPKCSDRVVKQDRHGSLRRSFNIKDQLTPTRETSFVRNERSSHRDVEVVRIEKLSGVFRDPAETIFNMFPKPTVAALVHFHNG